MHQPALKALHAGQIGQIRRREQAKPGDREPGPERHAAVGAHGPAARVLVEFGPGHAGLQCDVLAQTVAIDDPVEVGQNLGLGHELGRPRRLRVEVAVKRVLVDEALRIRQRARVLVPKPGAAHPARLVDGHRVQALLVAQFVQHVDPTETRAHDKGVEVADLIADDSIHRACSFDRQDGCGAVHFLDTMVGGSTRT